MVLVDSSVWIQYLSHRTPDIGPRLEALIRPAHRALITGVIYQEVLQGIRNPRSYELTKKLLGRLPFLIPSSETHVKASEIFLRLSEQEKKPATIDTLIAALAVEHHIPLFTLDKDFHLFAATIHLELF